jgi:hypothetical protein
MSKRGEHEEKARRAIAAAQESGPLGAYLTRVFIAAAPLFCGGWRTSVSHKLLCPNGIAAATGM